MTRRPFLTASMSAGAILAAAMLVGACADGRDPSGAESRLSRYSFSAPAMGTEFRIVVFAADSSHAARAAADAFSLADSLETIMSDYRPDSELNRLSSAAGSGRYVSVSWPLLHILLEARRVSEATGGSFDVTTGALTRLWRRGIRRAEVPADTAIAAALATVGYRSMIVDSAGRRVRLERSGTRLDLGGIAKGFAADRMLEMLRATGLARSLVDAGGDIAAGDAPPGKSGWRIAISSRLPEADLQRTITVSNAGLATSGDEYRYIESGDRRYSHVVDPQTGYGTTHSQAVTVLAPSATLADAYASAFIVMPPGRAIAFAGSHPNLEARILSRSDRSPVPVLRQTAGFPHR